MKYRIRNTQTGEIVLSSVYYATPSGDVRHVYHHTIQPEMKVEVCAGVVDLNGFEIYEGDILEHGVCDPRVVVLEGPSFVLRDITPLTSSQPNQIIHASTARRLIISNKAEQS